MVTTEMDLGPVAGLLLAGGRSSRLGGGDKALQVVAGRRLLDRVIERAAPQVCCLLLNANGDPDRFLSYGLPVIADGVGDHWGPLAGVLAGFRRLAETRPDIAWMATFATDTPLFPLDLVARLAARLVAEGADLAVAASAGRTHPVFALWPLRLAQPLHHALVEEGVRKVDAWIARYRAAVVDWPTDNGDDPFFNVNTAEDLAHLEQMLRRR